MPYCVIPQQNPGTPTPRAHVLSFLKLGSFENLHVLLRKLGFFRMETNPLFQNLCNDFNRNPLRDHQTFSILDLKHPCLD